MVWLLCLALAGLAPAQSPAPAPEHASSSSIDVSTLTVRAPATVADLGKLKGDADQLAWSGDGKQFYLETIEHNGKTEHYLIAAEGGAITKIDARPAWAEEFWKFKSDRYAPGVEALVIDVQQKYEQAKYGTGSAGASDPSSGGLTGENQHGASAANVSRAALSQTQSIVKLVLLGEILGTWVDQRPTPGTTFSWGPSGSGAIAFVDEKGQLVLLDNHQHKQPIAWAKDAYLPAWSMDGSRLAYLTRVGKNKYMLSWSAVARP
jgi:hypothetical protein